MELKNIYEIWDRFDESAATELELEMQGVRFCLKKQATTTVQKMEPQAVLEDRTKKEEPKAKPEQAEVTEVKAPLVGTFYRGSAPEEEPFVKPGQRVEKGEVIGIIEAMKLMNEVTAPKAGIVEEIMAEDGCMVEYNQVLLTIK